MHSTTFRTLPSSSLFTTSSKSTYPKPTTYIPIKPRKENQRKPLFSSLSRIHSSDSNIISSKPNTLNPSSSTPCLETLETHASTTPNVAEKVQCLVSEFKSLSESIDRVKRLLLYASVLPPFDESARLQENRVMGCTTQVWLEVKMDSDGLMRFRIDSDSEITKGFCSCLIWLLDGAAPEEVVRVKAEDLDEMNVGLYGRARSRVNTWHTVLISMQKKTKALVEERNYKSPQTFPTLIFASDGISSNLLSLFLVYCILLIRPCTLSNSRGRRLGITINPLDCTCSEFTINHK
ncbi:unnamed protein product [Ilex paraguariensis]|uniref:Fe-S metabolism associated domain-containing protein n=1 Tax=Ilex paraguariensis TaxID=185542 RepID=A0ABC8T9Q4_9AQUA